VIIPAFNAEIYIERTIFSILTQTYPINRIIIVNDGSNDLTLSMIQRIKTNINEPSKIEVHSKTNGGHASAVNFGIRLSDADAIALIDSDDVWLPTKIEEQVRVLQNNETIGLVYSDYNVIDDKDYLREDETSRRVHPSLRGSVEHYLLLDGNKISGSNSAVLIRSKYLKKELFDESLIACEDWDLWIRLSRLTEFDFVPKQLVQIRRHGNNQSSQQLLMLRSSLKVLVKHISKLGLIDRRKALFRVLSSIGPKFYIFHILTVSKLIWTYGFGLIEWLIFTLVVTPWNVLKKIYTFSKYHS
jgi:glycosyltransferase involved in cell wall biosynthesis